MKCLYGTGQTDLEDCQMAYIHIDGYYPQLPGEVEFGPLGKGGGMEIALSLLCPNRVPCKLCRLRTHPLKLNELGYCGRCGQRWSQILASGEKNPEFPLADYESGESYPHRWRDKK